MDQTRLADSEDLLKLQLIKQIKLIELYPEGCGQA